jgi:hypothetical protein
MPSKIVDLSARSEIIKNEPFYLHFWECTPDEYFDFIRNPRKTLVGMGIQIPADCRIETTIENHDWMEANTNGSLTAASGGPVIICNTGTGNVGRAVYRIVSFAHVDADIGKFTKKLLHAEDKQER